MAWTWLITLIFAMILTVSSFFRIHRDLRQKVPQTVFLEVAPFTDEAVRVADATISLSTKSARSEGSGKTEGPAFFMHCSHAT